MVNREWWVSTALVFLNSARSCLFIARDANNLGLLFSAARDQTVGM
jgi:hypothetical protein